MRIFLIITGLFLLSFMGMVFYLYLNQRKMLYYPQGLDRNWEHVKENVLYEHCLKRDGVALRGWLLNPNNKTLLVYYGGNGEEASLLIDQFKVLDDVSVLLMNYRGYGESEGQPSEENIIEDALALLDGVKEKYDSVVLLGRSLGSGVAVQVAANRSVDRLILVTPYDSIAAVGKGMYPWAPVRLLLKDPFDSLVASERVEVPALFLIAEFDTIIPHKHSQRLADRWKGPHEWVLISGSDHNSIPEFPAYWKAVSSVLSSNNGH